MIEEMNNIQKEDDGSLAFLNIPRDENSRSFNCDETTQSKLVNTSFWVVDFIEEVPTRFSKAKADACKNQAIKRQSGIRCQEIFHGFIRHSLCLEENQGNE